MPRASAATMPSRPAWTSLALLAALAVPTLWLARARLGIEVDLQNQSLKSIGTPQARAMERRIAGFGEDPTVVLVWRASGTGNEAIGSASAASVAELAAALKTEPGVREVRELATRDATALAWAVRFASDGARGWRGTVEHVEAQARSGTPAELELAIAGQPVAELAIASAVRSEQRRIVPLVVASLALLLLALYRRISAAVAILLPAGIGIVWTGGLFALLGHAMDPVAVMLDPVILTVGVASGVHLVEHYLSARSTGEPPWSAAHGAVRELWRPNALASFTTVVGFLSLAPQPIPAVANFGVFAALGSSLTALFVLLLSPRLLALLDRGVQAPVLTRRLALWSSASSGLTAWIARRPRGIVAAALLLAGAGAWAWTGIRVDNDPLRILPRAHALRRDAGMAAAALGGSETFDLLVPRGSPAAEPSHLALLAADLLARPGVVGPIGPPQLAANGDFLLSALLAPGGSRERHALFDAVEERAQAFGASEVQLAGTSVQVTRDSERLIRGQMNSLGLTLAVLFGVFWLAFRSLGVACLAMVPNVVPCLAVYGSLALAGLPVSVATAMISSVLLGLIVDDTIHLLHRYSESRQQGAARRAAIEEALGHACRPVVVTSLVLAGGFACSVFGELETSREWGALAAVTILVALLGDLLLLPALILARPTRATELAHG
jgi:predicted RND superfamily exporter protein